MKMREGHGYLLFGFVTIIIFFSILIYSIVTSPNITFGAETGQRAFRERLDSFINLPFEPKMKEDSKYRLRSDGLGEYVFTRPSGCSWAFVVDTNNIVTQCII
jgi:hypothetical protein